MWDITQWLCHKIFRCEKTRNFMRDFGILYANILCVNHSRNNRCKIQAFFLKNMHVFLI